MKQKQHGNQMSHGAAITLRLCEICGILGSRRFVYGDSFFSSIDTALQLKANGLFYSGIVKTAHAGYPKMFLQDWYEACWCSLLNYEPQNLNLRFTHGFVTAKLEQTRRCLYVYSQKNAIFTKQMLGRKHDNQFWY